MVRKLLTLYNNNSKKIPSVRPQRQKLVMIIIYFTVMDNSIALYRYFFTNVIKISLTGPCWNNFSQVRPHIQKGGGHSVKYSQPCELEFYSVVVTPLPSNDMCMQKGFRG